MARQAVTGDPAGQVWRHAEELRRAGMRDVLYVLVGPDLFRTLVLDRSWTRAQRAAFVERAILQELFGRGP